MTTINEKDLSKALTTSQKIKEKKKRGRPEGKRNKISVKDTLTNVLRQGKGLVELKEVCDYYVENAEAEGLTPKQVLDFLRTDIDLYKWTTEQLHKMEKEGGKVTTQDTPKKPSGSNIAVFKRTATDD